CDQLMHYVVTHESKPVAGARHTGILADLEDVTLGLVEGIEDLLPTLGVPDHRAELVRLETTAVEADALLHEEDRTVRVDLDGDRHEGEQRCKRDERDERHREIDHALDGEGERIRGSGEDRN